MKDEFHDLLIEALPKLRQQALALTRNRAAADDLVNDTVVNALGARASFEPGTNFRAWVHRILRNRFISLLRKRRDTTDVESLPPHALSSRGSAEDAAVLRELSHALTLLPMEQREALAMAVIQGMSYEEIAAATGSAVGTAKSRVFRARRTLQEYLVGEASCDSPAEASGNRPARNMGAASAILGLR